MSITSLMQVLLLGLLGSLMFIPLALLVKNPGIKKVSWFFGGVSFLFFVVSILLLISHVFAPGHKLAAQSVVIEFKIQNSDGEVSYYKKIIPFKNVLDISENIGFYECVVGENEYRVSLWANLYLPLEMPVPAVDIWYRFRNLAEGVGLAMPYKYFSVYGVDGGSSMMVGIFDTEFIENLRKDFPNKFKNNLNCQVIAR